MTFIIILFCLFLLISLRLRDAYNRAFRFKEMTLLHAINLALCATGLVISPLYLSAVSKLPTITTDAKEVSEKK